MTSAPIHIDQIRTRDNEAVEDFRLKVRLGSVEIDFGQRAEWMTRGITRGRGTMLSDDNRTR